MSQGFHPYDIAKFHRLLYRDSVVFAFWRPQWRRSDGGEEEAYEGFETGWDIMRKPLGSDNPEWID